MYTNNKITETESRKKIPFARVKRKIKYPGINLTKEVKDLYSENYRTLKKEVKGGTRVAKESGLDCTCVNNDEFIVLISGHGRSN